MAQKSYRWVLFLTTLLLLLLLFGFLGIWVLYGSSTNVMSLVGLQRARSEHMLKDALTLTYRTNTIERTQAISELQDTLPLWEETQRGLRTGDSSLGLPQHPPSDILLLLIQVQSDYTPMDVAFEKINAHPIHPDPAQVQIIMDHERPYFVIMSTVNTLWQQHIDEIFFHLFWIETGIVGGIASLVIINFIFTRRAS